MVKALFDRVLALIIFVIAIWVMVPIAIIIRLESKGPAIYWSQRVGRDNKLFAFPKFRTMYVGTPIVATHLLQDASSHVTVIGRFLRRTSLDELPQLWSILSGKMSFVGPRPALFNQDDLIALRTKADIHKLTPGLTGWAQINGRDDISIPEKVALDKIYHDQKSFLFDLKILYLTALYVLKKRAISH